MLWALYFDDEKGVKFDQLIDVLNAKQRLDTPDVSNFLYNVNPGNNAWTRQDQRLYCNKISLIPILLSKESAQGFRLSIAPHTTFCSG